MIGFIIRTVISAVALIVIASLSGGAIKITNYTTAIIVAIVLGLANAVVKPILMAIGSSMTCLLNCLTLGLWSLVLSWLLNGLIFYLAGQKFIPGFSVTSFWTALWAALALSIVNALASALTRNDSERR